MYRALFLATGLTLAGLTSAIAQSTGTPVFLSPYRPFQNSEFGISLSDPGVGIALEGFYRVGKPSYDLGFRLGIADSRNQDPALLLGIDLRARLVDHSADFPLDGAFTAGLGLRFDDATTWAFIPIGISLGRRVELEDSDVQFIPYFHPVIVPRFGNGDSDLLFAIGLGVDITFNKNFDLRVGGALGDYEGISISVALLR